MTTRVLFVCTGNICRSAFAQAAAASLAKDPDLVFASAGTHAMENNPATTTMQEAAAELGIDLTAHRSTPLRDSKQPDVVLGMEQQHLVAASRRFPDLDASRIRLLAFSTRLGYFCLNQCRRSFSRSPRADTSMRSMLTLPSPLEMS